LFAAGTFFATTRLTEGFATAFLPKVPGDDSGTRFLLQFTGLPAGSRIFVPDYLAGSTAAVPTAGGDLGIPQSGGDYVPGSSSMLLARVSGADGSGAGGTALGAPNGLGPIALNSATEIFLTGGNGYAVFEV